MHIKVVVGSHSETCTGKTWESLSAWVKYVSSAHLSKYIFLLCTSN